VKTEFHSRALTETELKVLSEGFRRNAESRSAPPYARTNYCWLLRDTEDELVGALTADCLWDWLYIDELWVHENSRGRGLGRLLMRDAENWAKQQQLVGIWLWTQSWEAEAFYQTLDYSVFTRFEDFPRGHARIGLRKVL